MTRLRCNGIDIECQVTGNDQDPLVVLIAGMGAQLTMWPPEYVRGIADAGFQVATFDNRDVGRSTWFDELAPAEEIRRALQGQGRMPVSYSLLDMAADTVALIEALGASAAHVVGMSMGGVIGQLMLLNHPGSVLSFVQIASTTGEPELPGSDPEIGKFLGLPPVEDGDEAANVARAVAFTRLIARDDADIEALTELATADFRRAHHPDGGLRQLVAVMSTPPRGAALSATSIPTLVIHGESDRMVPPACGRATADHIPGARLEVIEGMGHMVEARDCPRLTALTVDFLKQVGATRKPDAGPV